MNKTYVLAAVAVLATGTAAAGGAWYWHRSHDQMGIARTAMARGDLHTAQIALRTKVRNDPADAEGHFRLGAVQLALGDAVAAERELRLAQSNGWDARKVAPLLARAYLGQGHFRDLLKDFPVEDLPAEQAGPLLITRALADLGLEASDDAAAAIAEAERLVPQNADAPLAAARVALARNDAVTAEAKIDRALEIEPRSADALMLKGLLRRAARDTAASLAAFDAAIAVAPKAPVLRIERANTLLSTGQDQKAGEDIAVVLKADPRNAGANYLQMVLLVRAKDWVGADAALQQLPLVIGRLPRGEYFQALIKASLNQAEQAGDAATRYVARAPGDVAGYKLLARIHVNARRPQQAIEVLNRAVAAGIADAELLELLGSAYARTGQAALASQTFDRAAAFAHDNPQALSRLGALRLGAGDAAGAERELNRSLELSPDQVGATEQLVVAALAAGDVDRAAAAVEQLKQQPGIDPARLESLTGLVRFAQLDLDGARTAFEAALKADPTATGARLNLARVLVLQNRAADAEVQLNDVLRREPANPAALSGISGILLAQRRSDRMIELLEAARKAAPTNADLSVALAGLLADTGEARRAYDLLNGLPAPQATLAGVLTMRARLEVALGMQREAMDTYRQILAATPGNVNAAKLLVDLLVQANDVEGARQVIRKGLEAAPGNVPLLQASVGLEYRTGGLEAALRTATQLGKDPAHLPAGRLLKCELLMSVQRYGEAAAACQDAFAAAPSDQLAVAAGLGLNAAGHKAEAIRVLKEWTARHPDDVGTLQALGAINLQNRQFDDAERDLTAVLAKQPNDPIALNNLAWLYSRRNDPRALDLARKAFLLTPTAQVADTLGWILVNRGDAAGGLPLLRQAAGQMRSAPAARYQPAVTLNTTGQQPSDPSVFYHLAFALNATGQRDAAVAVLTPLVKSDSEFEDRPAARKLLDELGGPAK